MGAFIKAVKDELGIILLEEYLKILRTVNGIEYNGFILYGADEPLLNETPNQHVNGLIDCNKVWYENEWQKRRQIGKSGGRLPHDKRCTAMKREWDTFCL